MKSFQGVYKSKFNERVAEDGKIGPKTAVWRLYFTTGVMLKTCLTIRGYECKGDKGGEPGLRYRADREGADRNYGGVHKVSDGSP
ncbi:hypothetical protein CHISP_2668 [Chitinispirillum alkaliphilum]|nr:hypothetical protein CHISP_2668 [Chitinispirillum alkaliphilum]